VRTTGQEQSVMDTERTWHCCSGGLPLRGQSEHSS